MTFRANSSASVTLASIWTEAVREILVKLVRYAHEYYHVFLAAFEICRENLWRRSATNGWPCTVS